jgi:hypothetical protein
MIRETDQEIGAQPQVKVLDFLLPFLAVLWKDWPKYMELANVWPQAKGFTLRGKCPHCEHDAAFGTVTEPYIEDVGTFDHRMISAAACVACNGYILAILKTVPVTSNSNKFVYDCHYPLGKPPQLVSEAIPKNVLDDFNEALRCLSVDSPNATAEMCRRALQSSCEGFGADPKLNITEQIDWMASQGTITLFLKEMARTIRLAGNRAAHPPRLITSEEADAIVQFTREYFEHVYMTRARLAKYDFSKSSQKQKP